MALKNRKKLGNAINLILWNGLDRLHKDTRLDKSVLLDEAIEDLLKKYKRDDLLIEYNKKKKTSNKKAPRQPRRFFIFLCSNIDHLSGCKKYFTNNHLTRLLFFD